MVPGALFAGTSVEDFLGRSEHQSAERVRDVGVAMSTVGLLLALGVIVYLATVHRGSRREVRTLVMIAGLGGVALLAGATAELAGIQSVFGTGWADVLSVDVSSAAMMRAVAGLLVVFGLTDTVLDGDPPGALRWSAGSDSAFGLAGLALGVLSFSFDGHTVTEGPRWAALVADVVHVTAGAVWFGGIVALAFVAAMRHRTGGHAAEVIVRFSSVATVALAAVAVAGATMTWFVVDGVADLTDTVWGRRLLIKLAGVAVATALGAYHHFVTVPRLATGEASAAEIIAARTTIVVEALVLTFVVIATTILVNGSIN